MAKPKDTKKPDAPAPGADDAKKKPDPKPGDGKKVSKGKGKKDDKKNDDKKKDPTPIEQAAGGGDFKSVMMSMAADLQKGVNSFGYGGIPGTLAKGIKNKIGSMMGGDDKPEGSKDTKDETKKKDDAGLSPNPDSAAPADPLAQMAAASPGLNAAVQPPPGADPAAGPSASPGLDPGADDDNENALTNS